MDFEQNQTTGVLGDTPPVPEKHPQTSHKLLAVVLIVVISYFVGFKSGRSGYTLEPKSFKVVNQADQPKEVDYDLLWEAMDQLSARYVETPPNPQEMLYGAIKGVLESSGDPYTTFFPPQDLETFITDLKGSFEGIGAEISQKDNRIIIVAPLDESPAKKAGVLAQDVILKVNSEETSGWSTEQAVSKIRGKKGTQVTLTLYREGRDAPFDVTIIRDTIEIKSVKWEYKEVEKDGKKQNIAVISVSKFGEDTKPLFDKAVNEILTKNVSGIVLDLRNNPGGYLQTAVELASTWVPRGEIVVKEEHRSGEPVVYSANGSPRLHDIKTVALINGGSASASEILAGALQDHNLATLVGEKSFGKGSVQELIDLKDGSAIKVTVAKWITPGGKNLNKEGLHPNVEVGLSEEDIKNQKDPQMEKALEEIVK